MFKVDVFVASTRDFDRAQLARRQSHLLSEDPIVRVYVASAEDTVPAKLGWYRMGGEPSERLWHDVLGALKVQGDQLDRDFMHRKAAGMDLADLLCRAFEQEGSP